MTEEEKKKLKKCKLRICCEQDKKNNNKKQQIFNRLSHVIYVAVAVVVDVAVVQGIVNVYVNGVCDLHEKNALFALG